MLEGLTWQEVELHAEHLVPGLLLVGGYVATGLPQPHGFGKSELVGGAVFVAAVYALGLVAAHLSRMVLDLMSERWLRSFVFGRRVHGDRERLREALLSDT